MNKINKKIVTVFLMFMMMTMFVPSISNAKTRVATYTYKVDCIDGLFSAAEPGYLFNEKINDKSKFRGNEDEPLLFDMSNYDQIIVTYSEASSKLPNSFCFRFVHTGSDADYAKYMITIEEKRNPNNNKDIIKKIIFDKLAYSNVLDESQQGTFYVTPPKRNMGKGYVQPGALLHEQSEIMGYTPPIYKIKCRTKAKNITLETYLGNSTIQGDSMGSNFATHPQVYVFCDCGSGILASKTIKFTESQIGSLLPVNLLARYMINGSNSLEDTEGKTITFDGDALELLYTFEGINSEALDDEQSGGVEQMLAKIALSLGGLFRGVISLAAGKDLTFDRLVFNEYEKTNLNFWENKGTYVGVFKNVINFWFKAFSAWARVILVIVLLLMGIKAILYAGTEKQDKNKDMLVGWFLALVLLLIGPFLMKFAIEINNALVKVFRDNSEYSIYSVYNTDFINKYYRDGDGNPIEYQIGEDSETSQILELLKNIRDTIAGDLAAKRENSRIIMKRLSDTRVAGKGTDPYIHIKSNYFPGNRGFTRAIIATENRIDALKMTPSEARKETESIRVLINNLPRDIEKRLESFLGTTNLNAGIRKAFVEYAQYYAEMQILENDMVAVDRAIVIADKGIDLEGAMRERAGKTYRLTYVAVWFVMMYQLVLLLVLYYKRMLVTSMLIAIYPLVIMMYAIEKLMDIGKPQTIRTWATEFIVNIFIQSVHAMIYVVLVETGLRIYEADSDNWIMFLLAVTALIPMETVVKTILGMKASSVSSLKDSAANAAKMALVAAGTAKAMSGIPGAGRAIDAKYNAQDKKAGEKADKQDKKQEHKIKKAENKANKKIEKQEARGQDTTATKMKLDQKKKKAAEKSRKRGVQREKAQNRRDRKRKFEKVAQPLRNLMALNNTITSGLANGGDANSFAAANSVASMISGKRKHSKINAKEASKNASGGGNSSGSSTSGGSRGSGGRNSGSSANNRDRYANNPNAGRNSSSSSNYRNGEKDRATQNANAATKEDYGNGRAAPTAREARQQRKRARRSSDFQNKCRENLANRMDVKDTHSFILGENNQDE